MTWLLGARAFLGGIPKWVWGALAIVLLVIAFMVWLGDREEAAEQRGETKVREEVATETNKQVERGNEVRNEIELEAARGAGNGLYRECLHANRGAPEVCERFLPQ